MFFINQPFKGAAMKDYRGLKIKLITPLNPHDPRGHDYQLKLVTACFSNKRKGSFMSGRASKLVKFFVAKGKIRFSLHGGEESYHYIIGAGTLLTIKPPLAYSLEVKEDAVLALGADNLMTGPVQLFRGILLSVRKVLKIKIIKINKVNSPRGLTYELKFLFGLQLTIYLRNSGVNFGGHYHQGDDPAKNPEVLLLLKGRVRARFIGLGGEQRERLLKPFSLIVIRPRIKHFMSALADTVLVEFRRSHFNPQRPDTYACGES
jgi:hypothetical protein